MRTEFKLDGTKGQRDVDGGRILLGDNRRRDGHAAADPVTMCLSLQFH